MSQKAYVVMTMLNNESWGPSAVFMTQEAADSACVIMNTRLFGQAKGEWESGFTVHPVDLDPIIKDTGDQRYWHKDRDDDTEGFEGYPVDGDELYGWCDVPDSMYSLATLYEQGEMEQRSWYLRSEDE